MAGADGVAHSVALPFVGRVAFALQGLIGRLVVVTAQEGPAQYGDVCCCGGWW